MTHKVDDVVQQRQRLLTNNL